MVTRRSRWIPLCALLATPALASCESDAAVEDARAQKQPKETASEVGTVAIAEDRASADGQAVTGEEGMVSNVGAVAELRPTEAVGDTRGIVIAQDGTEARGETPEIGETGAAETTTEDGAGTQVEYDDTFGDTDAFDEAGEEDSWGTGFEDDDTFGDTNAFD